MGCFSTRLFEYKEEGEEVIVQTRRSSNSMTGGGNRFWRNFFKRRDNPGGSTSNVLDSQPDTNVTAEKVDFKRRASLVKKTPHGKFAKDKNRGSSCPIEEKIAAKKVARTKSPEDMELIQKALHANMIVSLLDDVEMNSLAEALDYYPVGPHDIICQEGSHGSFFFIIHEGTYEVREGDKLVNTMSRGQAFGEISLINKCPRSATVVSTTNGGLWGVQHLEFRSVLQSLSSRNYAENRRFLEAAEIFNPLTDLQKKKVCDAMHISMHAEGTTIVKQGEPGDCLYCIKSGVLQVLINEDGEEKVIRKLTQGSYFGERSLLYSEPRSATVIADSAVVLVSIGLTELEQAFGAGLNDQQSSSFTVLRMLFRNLMEHALRDSDSRIFAAFTCSKAVLEKLLRSAVIREYALDTVIHEKRERPESPESGSICVDNSSSNQCLAGVRFFIVLEGAVEVGEDKTVYKRGTAFGDEYVMDFSSRFNYTVKTIAPAADSKVTNVKLALFGKEALSLVKSGDFEMQIDYATKLKVLRNVTIFRSLSNQQNDLLVKAFTALPLAGPGKVIIQQGEIGGTFYIIKSGEVKAEKDGKLLRTMGKHDYFGERALLYDEPRSATVTVTAVKTELWCVDKSVFMQIIQGKMLEYLEYRIRLQDTTMEFEDLRIERVVGRGTFGTVKLVVHKKTKTRYALKCVRKIAVMELKQEESIKMEREILAENDHPFIIRLVRTFKDDRFLYFLTELVTGGELYDAIRKLGILTPCQSQFYFASMGLAMDYLHERTIVYRDLKPENVLLDSQGYVKVIDFGCARKLNGEKSYSLVGTPHYMAPEVILGKGYTSTADIWSLGVCLYEFVCGPLPFGNDADEQLEVFKDILTGRLSFPGYVNCKPATELMKRLLSRHPENRIGCSALGGGFAEIQSCKFFDDFDWEKLKGRELTPPILPEAEIYAEDSEEPGSHISDDELPPPVHDAPWDASF
eukprot:GEMP01002192.1.p1 GENE.GEMP01002192.1~~GEMP01002192.1.p1  ORF type:complete len:968 (+),score=173.95 GEMP01002192.1:11-2914(+)